MWAVIARFEGGFNDPETPVRACDRAYPHMGSERPEGFRPGWRVDNVWAAVTNPARILLVDDDMELRHSLAEVLTDAGYVVSCAPNGEEALLELKRAEAPSAIVLDLAMPVMDGWTFRSRQRSDPRLAAIPTIVISASHAADPRLVGRLAPDAFLRKPFDLDRLIDALRQVCAASAGVVATRTA